MTVLYSNPCYKEVCYMLVVPVFVVLAFKVNLVMPHYSFLNKIIWLFISPLH